MKTILITGTSSGFGKLTVPLLLVRGHTVIAGIRGGEARLQAIFAEELKRYPGKLIAADIHMEKQATFEQARRLIDERFGGKLDVLINNAGFGLFGSLEDLSEEQLRHQFEVNFFGPMLLTRQLLPALRRSRGRIINLSSIGGRITFPLYGVYTATKYATEAMSESLYYELKPLGVQVALVEPGGFRTEFAKGSKQFGEGSMKPESPYLAQSRGLDRMFQATGNRLPDPIAVARRIARLVDCRRMPLRNPVGLDARAGLALFKVIPDSFRVFLTRVAFRFVLR